MQKGVLSPATSPEGRERSPRMPGFSIRFACDTSAGSCALRLRHEHAVADDNERLVDDVRDEVTPVQELVERPDVMKQLDGRCDKLISKLRNSACADIRAGRSRPPVREVALKIIDDLRWPQMPGSSRSTSGPSGNCNCAAPFALRAQMWSCNADGGWACQAENDLESSLCRMGV